MQNDLIAQKHDAPMTGYNPPLAGWRGGKSLLAKEIIARIPDHTCYVEPFAGAAWVLFRKPESKVEVINDINKDVVNLYRVVQHHLPEFLRQFQYILVARDEFDRLKAMNPETLTDVQRAVRFFYLFKNCFAGKVENLYFGYSATHPPRLNLPEVDAILEAGRKRLSKTRLEYLPYQAVIQKYDRAATFFYIDPPYHGKEADYGKGIFTRDDFRSLATQLEGIQGKFLLSINDAEDVRDLFATFHIEEVETRYSCSKTTRKKYKELFIKNY